MCLRSLRFIVSKRGSYCDVWNREMDGFEGSMDLNGKVRSTEIDALAQVVVECGGLLPLAHYEIWRSCMRWARQVKRRTKDVS